MQIKYVSNISLWKKATQSKLILEYSINCKLNILTKRVCLRKKSYKTFFLTREHTQLVSGDSLGGGERYSAIALWVSRVQIMPRRPFPILSPLSLSLTSCQISIVL